MDQGLLNQGLFPDGADPPNFLQDIGFPAMERLCYP
jgi:hypothetical protein